MEKSADAYRTISEVADDLKLPQHVLRFWETRFPQVKPMKRGGNRRFYRPEDVELLQAIKTLLYGDGFTIKGVQRILKEQGPRAVASLAQSGQLRPSAKRRESPHEPEPRSALGLAESTDASPTVLAREPGPRVLAAAPPPPAPDAAISPARQSRDSGSVSGDLVDALQSVLFELAECKRILAVARG